MSFLLDTNVISEARRRTGNASVKAWLASVPLGQLFISVLVIGEIRRGVERIRRRDPPQATMFEPWLTTVERDYGDRIVPITHKIAHEWGRMNAVRPLPTIDGLMAATAKVRGFTLVTRNTIDFAQTGVPLLNPFAPVDG